MNVSLCVPFVYALSDTEWRGANLVHSYLVKNRNTHELAPGTGTGRGRRGVPRSGILERPTHRPRNSQPSARSTRWHSAVSTVLSRDHESRATYHTHCIRGARIICAAVFWILSIPSSSSIHPSFIHHPSIFGLIIHRHQFASRQPTARAPTVWSSSAWRASAASTPASWRWPWRGSRRRGRRACPTCPAAARHQRNAAAGARRARA